MPFGLPRWVSRRFSGRATVDEVDEALHLDADTSLNAVPENERLLFQYIVRRWINEMDQRTVEEADLHNLSDMHQVADNDQGGVQTQLRLLGNDNNSGPEIPILNMEDVDLALREHVNTNNQRGTIWIQMIDILGVTLFPMLFIRILKNVFSFISFSDDVLEDTENFLTFVQDNSFDSLINDNTKVNSLISKFGRIVYEELVYYSPNPRPLLARFLTLVCFYIYTTLTSLFMMVSFVFLLLCLTYTFGKRWNYIDKFLISVTRSSNGVF